jgi:hypothetical protein
MGNSDTRVRNDERTTSAVMVSASEQHCSDMVLSDDTRVVREG